MKEQMAKYRDKLLRDRSAEPGSVCFLALDDAVVSSCADGWRPVLEKIISALDVAALLFAAPAIPFADLLIARAPLSESRIYPKDSEIKTFLHDIPFIRREELTADPAAMITERLRERKGIILEGRGFIAQGAITVEQAYINWSSIFHGVFIKYLHDLLTDGFRLPGEREALLAFREGWLRPPDPSPVQLSPGPLTSVKEITEQMIIAGRGTVELGLVDSFFGNISAFQDGVIHISETGAPLDELSGLIDPVPLDNSSTCGVTASSELRVHRAIYETTPYRFILHGHPRFSVVMSIFCEDEKVCPVADCATDCPRVRMLGDIPVVSGEIGAGGVAKQAPPVVAEFGRALVYGHGPFCVGMKGFAEPFFDLMRIENFCRERYFAMLHERWG